LKIKQIKKSCGAVIRDIVCIGYNGARGGSAGERFGS